MRYGLKKGWLRLFGTVVIFGFISISCHQAANNVIPAMPVNINLGDAALWNTYGVSGMGLYQYFIKNELPRGFFYSEASYTGFGGVLLISGMDPFTGDPNVPLAYDLSCPVECRKDIRVEIDESTLYAVCPKCHSQYNVLAGGGIAVKGEAYNHRPRYGLQRYTCVPYGYGGYIIRD